MKISINKQEKNVTNIDDGWTYSLTFEGMSQTEIIWLSMFFHKESLSSSPRAVRFYNTLQEQIDKFFLKD
jgi:hypothetical protein